MKNVFTILAKWRDLTSDRMHWIMENTANIMTMVSTVVIPAIEKIAPPEEERRGDGGRGGRGKMVEREGDKGEESEREGKGRVHRITANAREAKIHIHVP